MIARWMIVGFVLWIIVAVTFRFVGGEVFLPGQDGVTWMFMILPVSMLVITYLLLIVLKVEQTDRAEAASIMAVPGLLIGIYQINSFRVVFPDIDPSLASSFASLMYACYAAVIIAGLVASRLTRV
ncbi:MAG: hypothetical protein DCF16_00005 [Alphaproteobacteria bacterium]|nr:MAG: hypothetical protein DCF16_00005 [Alphaproteobacteria bacterium]